MALVIIMLGILMLTIKDITIVRVIVTIPLILTDGPCPIILTGIIVTV